MNNPLDIELQSQMSLHNSESTRDSECQYASSVLLLLHFSIYTVCKAFGIFHHFSCSPTMMSYNILTWLHSTFPPTSEKRDTRHFQSHHQFLPTHHQHTLVSKWGQRKSDKEETRATTHPIHEVDYRFPDWVRKALQDESVRAMGRFTGHKEVHTQRGMWLFIK